MSNKSIECPFCYGGIVFHITYGTEKDCDICKGKGTISDKKLKALDLDNTGNKHNEQ